MIYPSHVKLTEKEVSCIHEMQQLQIRPIYQHMPFFVYVAVVKCGKLTCVFTVQSLFLATAEKPNVFCLHVYNITYERVF